MRTKKDFVIGHLALKRVYLLDFFLSKFCDFDLFLGNLSKKKHFGVNFLKIGPKLDSLQLIQKYC